MSDQHSETEHSKQGMTDQKTGGGWEKGSLGGERAIAQALASNSYPEAIQRWVQESNDDAPWNAVDYLQMTSFAEEEQTGEGKTSTNGAAAGSETSASEE
ncbi:MAG: hypothetical protein Q9161_001900 [Pseudevernia consocians]